MSVLKQASPDQTGVLDTLQCNTVAEASLICFNRSDWGFFVSMFGCIWGEALRKWTEDEVVAVLLERDANGDGRFATAAARFWSEMGFTVHPCVLLEEARFLG